MIVKKSIDASRLKANSPWLWVPSLFFTESMVFVIVTAVSVLMYKRLGLSNSDIAFYTSWIYLPWLIKPLWSPLVDLFKNKSHWIWITQSVTGAAIAGVAFTIPIPDSYQFTIAFLWIIAFSAATNNIASDGYYLQELTEKQQSFFMGVRNLFYRFPLFFGQALALLLATFLESSLSIGPGEIRVSSVPYISSAEVVKIDSLEPKELSGALRIITEPSNISIGAVPTTAEEVSSFSGSAHNFNIMNGFTRDRLAVFDSTATDKMTGNIGIVKLRLSKKPNKEINAHLDFVEGNDGIKIIEGKTIRFNPNNWNKWAFAVIQLDQGITGSSGARFLVRTGSLPVAWSFAFGIAALLFMLFAFYHKAILSKTVPAVPGINGVTLKGYTRVFFRYFEKPHILTGILFLLFFRLGEAQLSRIALPFLLGSRESGGLGLSVSDAGLFYSTAGICASILGSLLGGLAIGFKGLKFWIWPMLLAVNIPHLIYVYLAYAQPTDLWIIFLSVAGEQFLYGFGFSAFMVYLFYLSGSEYKSSHYAISAGFMTIGLILPGAVSGQIQELLGYRYFFVYLLFTMIPSILIIKNMSFPASNREKIKEPAPKKYPVKIEIQELSWIKKTNTDFRNPQ
jgi:MFS transporter, PAT family, beta-lactamase induction signal transducer AmpG